MDKVMKIRRYEAADKSLWDSFVEKSRNATFLFRRDYMDYHADRFEDYSLIALRNGTPVAMLPADLTHDGVIHSHRGLTYGGWILPPAHLDGTGVLEVMEAACGFCRREGMVAIDYKPLPWIYARRPSQEDMYALFRLGATLCETNLSSTLDLTQPPGFNTLQRRLLRKGASTNSRIESSPMDGPYDVAPFWNMLADCLASRHEARPVHSLEELQMLRDRFPAEIRLHTVILNETGKPEAGVCIFLTDTTVHCQYICTSEIGREHNLLPLLFHHLIYDEYAPESKIGNGRRWFDLGTSNEEGGQILNNGLLRQKYSFGATGVAYQRFRLEL